MFVCETNEPKKTDDPTLSKEDMKEIGFMLLDYQQRGLLPPWPDARRIKANRIINKFLKIARIKRCGHSSYDYDEERKMSDLILRDYILDKIKRMVIDDYRLFTGVAKMSEIRRVVKELEKDKHIQFVGKYGVKPWEG